MSSYYPNAPAVAGPNQAPALAPERRARDRSLRPTLLVAAAIAAVVLGGIGLDRVIPEPSIGRVAIGAGATISAEPGWQRVDTGDSSGLLLQKGDVRLVAEAQAFTGQPQDLLRSVEQSLQADVDQITFGSEQTGRLGAYEAASVNFVAVDSSSGNAMEGEVICLVAGPDGVVLEAAAPQGSLQRVAGDVTSMAKSVQVGS